MSYSSFGVGVVGAVVPPPVRVQLRQAHQLQEEILVVQVAEPKLVPTQANRNNRLHRRSRNMKLSASQRQSKIHKI
ncbi:hypothetical protein NUQ34_04095 [Glaesserella parasuis]|uniref:hypothetical protein n=1 Tax=Glaesserella parasuis TaxID=738 RepID=UPI002436E302|nr:hypothetical protein [Glaesserella parasuis]MDE3933163.1 hypothetical protein [Glaesserella parasuis]MDE3944731.1 hypothetical protein [Glaesserella parasuis]MDG6428652.1 hypothetical protein [Glaesserella parasuis]MDG6842422.1 hypothetical protein [Glaesserella parasuis]MDO9762866.1 hypothetical protein [Glaesserella parasuis]